MKTHALLALVAGAVMLALLALVAGCGSAPASGGGYGADARPWPQAPARSTPAAAGEQAQPPTVPVTFTLRGKAAAEHELRLSLTQIELRYGSRWHTVAKAEDIAKNETLPLKLGAKESFALLARTAVPRRTYTYARLTFAKEKTVLARAEQPNVPLVVETVPLAIGEWAPSDARPNLITFTVDGTQVKFAEDVILPATALAAKTLSPTGGITGTITPATPTARVEVFWGASKVLLGSVTPSAQDGSFTVANLPAGLYRVEVSATGQRLSEPLRDPVAVEDKPVTVKTLELVNAAKE